MTAVTFDDDPDDGLTACERAAAQAAWDRHCDQVAAVVAASDDADPGGLRLVPGSRGTGPWHPAYGRRPRRSGPGGGAAA